MLYSVIPLLHLIIKRLLIRGDINMGTKQIFFILLSLFLVITAIVAGLQMFRAYMREAHQDTIISGLMHIADAAIQYRTGRAPHEMGEQTYLGFEIPEGLALNTDADYEV